MAEKCLKGEKEKMFNWLRDFFVSKEDKMKTKLDINKDGKVDLKDVAEAAQKIEEKIEQVAAPAIEKMTEVAKEVKSEVNLLAEKTKSKVKRATKSRPKK